MQKWAGFFIYLLIFHAPLAWAGVYQCVNETGAIEYRDFPCSAASETFLPIQYSKTNINPPKTNREKKEFKQASKAQAILARKKERAKQHLSKQTQIQIEKETRRKARCIRTREKIAEIESKMRGGRKLKSFQRLQEELEHHQRMERLHCN